MPRFDALALDLGPTTLELPAELGEGEVAVDVAAMGVNRADLLQQRGLYPAPPGAPQDVLGLELAGTIASGPRQGERVMAIVPGGAFARRVILHERELLPIPDRLSLPEAAAIPEAFLTAYDALFRLARLREGERALIHAAASGVGTAAIQLARGAGAVVVGTTRTARKLAAIADLGAEPVLVEGARFSERVRPVDVIVDLVGAAYFAENLASIASLGRWVVLGLLGGGSAELPLGTLLSRRVTLVGSVLRSRSRAERIELAQAFWAHAGPALSDGRLRPVVEEVFPIHAAKDAFHRLADGQTVGKLVLKW